MNYSEKIGSRLFQEAKFSKKRRSVILSAASAFGKRGYHNTSMAQIAEALGLKKATLYHYVRNKEEILYESHLLIYESMVDIIDKMDDTKAKAVDVLENVYRELVFLLTETGISLLTDVDSLKGELKVEILSCRNDIESRITRIVKRGQKDGSINDGDPKLFVFFFMGALNWLNAWYEVNGRLSRQDIANHFVIQLRRGVDRPSSSVDINS